MDPNLTTNVFLPYNEVVIEQWVQYYMKFDPLLEFVPKDYKFVTAEDKKVRDALIAVCIQRDQYREIMIKNGMDIEVQLKQLAEKEF